MSKGHWVCSEDAIGELIIPRGFVGINQKTFKAVVAPVTVLARLMVMKRHRGLDAAQTLPPC